MSDRAQILAEIAIERQRQERLKEEGEFTHSCADPEMSDGDRLAALVEEVGEAAEAMIEAHGLIGKPKGTDLRKELIEVAAVAVAWIEALDAGGRESRPPVGSGGVCGPTRQLLEDRPPGAYFS